METRTPGHQNPQHRKTGKTDSRIREPKSFDGKEIAGIESSEAVEIEQNARVELAQRYAREKDILNWGRVLFPEKFHLPFCRKLHDYFIEIRLEPLTDTEAPRNHAKTLIKCFLIPLFQAINEPNLFKSYLNVQSTKPKALSINMSIKTEIETSELLRVTHGNQMGEDKWTDTQFVLKNGVVFTAVSAGESIRGINYRNIRPDYIVVDDLYDEDDIHNIESTEKKNDWFWGSLYPARARSRRCSIHLQGTAINQWDLLHKIKTQTRWKSRTFRAIEDEIKKEVLWPELNTFESLILDRTDMGSVIFNREMQNERMDQETAIIKTAWLAEWEFDPDALIFNDDLILNSVILTCDPSIGAKLESDFTGSALMLEAKVKDTDSFLYYIMGLWNEHLSLDKRVELLQGIAKAQPDGRQVRKVIIEGIAGFKDFVAEVRRRTSLPVKEIDAVKDKITNLENKSHWFENKKVFLNKNIEAKLKDMLKYQLTNNFPKHDDVRDAVLLGLRERKTGPTVTIF